MNIRQASRMWWVIYMTIANIIGYFIIAFTTLDLEWVRQIPGWSMDARAMMCAAEVSITWLSYWLGREKGWS